MINVCYPFVGDSIGGSHISTVTLIKSLQNKEIDLYIKVLVFSSNDRFSVYEEENCYVENENDGRGLFGNYEIGSEIDCDFGDDLVEKFDDPTNLAMLGLIVTVGATLLQMARGN